MNSSRLPGSPFRLWILHFGFITAVPIYAVVMMLVRTSMGGDAIFSSRPLQVYAAISAISLVVLIMGFTVPVWMKAVADQPGDSAQAYLNKRMTELIVTDALFESIAIYGLVGVVLGMQPWQGLSLMVVSLLFLLSVLGRLRAWIDEYDRRLRLESRPA
jgi:F0F1-type ATP synthase membrane subunit c/vacuolar-type H+-ATPase subunit K